jgi:uncharacterized protein YaiI (UPF0178 family)
MRLILLLLATFSSIAVLAQRKEVIVTTDEVIKRACLELDQAMSSPDGSLYKFGTKYNISGEYTLLLTLRDNGQVVSVFVQDKKDGNIASQNSLKDKLLDFQFNFKMQKKKDYKLSYTFKF